MRTSSIPFAICNSLILLTACSDDIKRITEIDQSGTIPVISKNDTLPNCTAEEKGNIIYIEDSLSVYFCNSEQWQLVKGEQGTNGTNGKDGSDGENGASCSVKPIKNGFKVLCAGDSVGVLLNGANGSNGSNGTNGQKGTSCSVKETTDGFDVLCGDKKVGSLKNGLDGEKGDQGAKGEPGESCSVQISATGYDVYCGGILSGTLSNGLSGAKGEQGEKGDVGESCTVKTISNGFEVFCGEVSMGTLVNGTNGEKGETGAKGENGEKGETGAKGEQGEKGDVGESCTVKAIENGFEVLCGGVSMGTLMNGSNGVKGDQGEKGDDCTLTDNGDGTVTQNCGEETVILYKALCGTEPYDPAGTKFCYGVTLYEKCGGKAFDVRTEQCVDGTVTSL